MAEEWTDVELQNFLLELATTKELLLATVFIDALDEGGEDDVRNIVAFFEQFIEQACSAGMAIRICFSSRHFPRITIRRAIPIVVENEAGHGQAIEAYIRDKMVVEADPQMDDLRQRVRDL